MGLKPRTPNEGQPDQAYVSTITAEDLAAYAEYADGYESDEEEAEEERPQRPNFALKLSSAVRNFSLPSPEEIKVIALYIFGYIRNAFVTIFFILELKLCKKFQSATHGEVQGAEANYSAVQRGTPHGENSCRAQ